MAGVDGTSLFTSFLLFLLSLALFSLDDDDEEEEEDVFETLFDLNDLDCCSFFIFSALSLKLLTSVLDFGCSMNSISSSSSISFNFFVSSSFIFLPATPFEITSSSDLAGKAAKYQKLRLVKVRTKLLYDLKFSKQHYVCI